MWNLLIGMKKRPGNELTLYCLCRMYNCHAVIYTNPGYWTTLKDDKHETEVCTKCDIVMLYLGKNKFCEVTETAASGKRKRATKSLSELVSIEKNTIPTRQSKPRVRLNPTKHEHNTRGSIRKRNNERPGRKSSVRISYVPEITSSEMDTEPPLKRQRQTQASKPVTDPVGPSDTRIRAQEMITRSKLKTNDNVKTTLIGTCIVSPPPKVKSEIKKEIKLEISKPLTKEQKERRRRRNRKENEETEWDHIHYKPGKGFLCCEHVKTKKNTSDHTENRAVNTENVDKEQTKQPDNPLASDKQTNTARTATCNIAVNTENANVDQYNPSATTEQHDTTPVNTENVTHQNEQSVTNNTTIQPDPERRNAGDNPALQPDDEPSVPANAEQSTSSSKVMDAVDGLLLLSGSEDTLDGFESQCENQIKFTQEVDMETLMTALHILSPNENTDYTEPTTSKNVKQNSTIRQATHQQNPTSAHLRNTGTPKIQQKTVTTMPPTSPKGRIKIRNVTLKRHKDNAQNYYCQLCNDNVPYKGVHALNDHHRNQHTPVQCGVCNKWCSTPENLRHHSYTHYDKKFQCATCTEEFNFKSELQAHLIVHDAREGIHQCMKGGCGKRFKQKSELSAHVKIHTGMLWKCDVPGCDFEAPDKRYLQQHKNKHTANNYICKYCQAGFSHYMQHKWHYEKNH